ncbi:hypothetical protein [Streptomyces sp. NPDC046860]|uniref:hypothetical protein n=1 Tax=Streptomyces sp. NPDC046860 TaxID=3154495 RepID=UPI00340AE156
MTSANPPSDPGIDPERRGIQPGEEHSTKRARPKDTRKDRHRWELARGPITAFGETKVVSAWAKDARCTVNLQALRTRLALGWNPETAISRPRHERGVLEYTHAGRTMTLRGWADQSGIKYHTLWSRIKDSGMSFEAALDKGAEGAHFTQLVSAFGETKPVSHWAVDARANCAATTLLRRLAEGWEPERAIIEEPLSRSNLGSGLPYHAFGHSMGIEDWGRHTQIPAGMLVHRMERHQVTLEAALRSFGWAPSNAVDSADAELTEVTSAHLHPRDHIPAVSSDADPIFTVRRPAAPPAETQRRSPAAPLPSTRAPAAPAPSSPPPVRRR